MSWVSLCQLALPLLLGAPGGPVPANPPPPAAEVEAVRRLMTGIHFKDERESLIRMGTSAFPAFEAIITDPKSDRWQVARAFGVLAAVDADRRRFLGPAVDRLTDPNVIVRWGAVALLARIGSEADMMVVLPLLDDHEVVVRTAAAEALAAAGGKRTLAAMNVWLWVAEVRTDVDGDHLVHVRKQRDALAERLKKALPPKAAAPAKK